MTRATVERPAHSDSEGKKITRCRRISSSSEVKSQEYTRRDFQRLSRAAGKRHPLRSGRLLFLPGLVGTVVLLLSLLGLAGRPSKDFDLSRHSVPLDQIVLGGPGRDGIPAILNPLFVRAKDAGFLTSDDRVLGLSTDGETKAYPVKILNWHEIVNDTIGGKPVVVTYCPLCGSGIAFEALGTGRIPREESPSRRNQGGPDEKDRLGQASEMDTGQRYTFGVSGLLYQSDLLMYDHQTESLWSQIAMEAVAGPLTGTKLKPLYLAHTTWDEWRAEYPNTLVLSTKTGHKRDYDRDPYLGYTQRPDLMFPAGRIDRRYHLKERVLGLDVNGVFKAYPFSELNKVKGPLTDQVNGRTIHIHFNAQARSASATDADGNPLPSMMAFWFAWAAFHPDTQVFTAP